MSVNGFGLYDKNWDKEQTMYKSEQDIIMTPIKTFATYIGAEFITLTDKEFKTKYDGKEYQFIVGSTTVKNGDKIHQLESPVTLEKGVISVPFWDLVEIWNLSAKIETDSKILDRYEEPIVAVLSIWTESEKSGMINITDPKAKIVVSNSNEWVEHTKNTYKKAEKGFNEYYIDRVFIDTRDIYDFYFYEEDLDIITDIATSNENVSSESIVFIKNGKIIGEAFYQKPSEKYKDFNFWFIDPADKELPTTINPEEIKNCQNIGFYQNGINVMTVIPNPFYREEGGR